MRIRHFLFLIVVIATPVAAFANENGRSACEKAVSELGFSTRDYAFEKGGFLGSDTHHFDKIACRVENDGSIERIMLGDLVLAENGLVGPHLVRLSEYVHVASSELKSTARARRQAAVDRARENYDAEKKQAYEEEDFRVSEITRNQEKALARLRDGKVDEKLIAWLGVDASNAMFQSMSPAELRKLASKMKQLEAKSPSWTELAEGYLEAAKSAAIEAYEDPQKAAEDLAQQGYELIEVTKSGTRQAYEVTVKKTGEVYELISEVDVCETVEVINNEAVSFAGGVVTGVATAAKAARPSRALVYIQRTYDQVTVIRGVGFVQRSFTSGLIATKVVPAIPAGVSGAATASAVVYLGATGVCYVTSPEAKEHLEAARSYSFSALDVAKEKVEAIIRYVAE